METFRINLIFICPYIAQRNGGNRIIKTGLSYKKAKEYLLEKHNDLFDRYFLSWESAIKFYKKHSFIDGLYKTDKHYRLDYDSRIFKIEEEF